MLRTIRVLTMSLAVIFPAAGVASSDDKPAEKPKADPPGTPLEVTLTGKKSTFTLDTAGLSVAEYQKKLEEMVKSGNRPTIAPPTVDLTLEIKNTSDKPVTVWISGDPMVLELTLKGKNAVNALPKLAFTREYRVPQGVEIAPGKSHAIPVKALVSGYRGTSKYSYWTDAGEYELVAQLKTGMSPAPKGAKDAGDGFGIVTVTSAPLKIMVEEKK